MPIYEFEGKRPAIGARSFVHPEAVMIGDVVIGEGCYIAAGAVLRGDWCRIRVGNRCNIQDNCVIHAAPDREAVLGDNCHIGHGAIVHEALLGNHVLVGMGAVVQDGARVGDDAIVGAGCVILVGKEIPPRKVVVGVPGEVVGDVSEERAKASWAGTQLYQALPSRYQKAFREIKPDEL
ncbi:MAG: gamma carbonic anhydrase family protein [Chloroflexi bacterium]|nr:gamma carbonic anhydrase family protein [Chloroflexota bacterium]